MRELRYRINSGTPTAYAAAANPKEILSANGVEVTIEIQVRDGAAESNWSNLVTATPVASVVTPTFAVPGPTILQSSSTSNSIAIQYHTEDLSDKINMPDVWYGYWDRFNANTDSGDVYKGFANHAKMMGLSDLNVILAAGFPVVFNSNRFSGSLVDPTIWEPRFTTWRDQLAGVNPDKIVGLMTIDEPYTNVGWNQQTLEDMIAVGKSILPSHIKIGFTITQGSVHKWSGTTGDWPRNADFIQMNHYPYRIDALGNNEGITSDSKSAFMSTSNSWALPRSLNVMAERMQASGIDPADCDIQITGQSFGGYEGTKGWRYPPNEAPLWYAEAINNFNTGVYTNRGFNVALLTWWVWQSGGINGTRENMQLFKSQKKIDVFNRTAATINNVRVNWRNNITGNVSSAVVSNTGSHTITGLPSGTLFRVWVESQVSGEYSAASNFLTIST